MTVALTKSDVSNCAVAITSFASVDWIWMYGATDAQTGYENGYTMMEKGNTIS